MKKIRNLLLIVALAIALLAPHYMAFVDAAQSGTGYKSSSDVVYSYDGKYVKNWGARGEDCTFLSPKAIDFYGTDYGFDVFSEYSGGTSKSDAYSSQLYKQLQSLMVTAHTYKTSYDGTKNLYKYTDCIKNDDTTVSCFYTAALMTSKWNSGNIWNREHTWPKSKETNGDAKTDIMMLRPTNKSANSGRGNTAYGESSGYYDPDDEKRIVEDGWSSVRGDCARIVLYVYTRWGNTSYMWGTKGVMESLDVLLKWMEEDPVDTWEMGRNDAVQAITGTRNVFVDYPEYAFLLFGREIPSDMVTPSGNASNGQGGNTSGGNTSGGNTDGGNSSGSVSDCNHTYINVDIKQPTETEDGYVVKICTECGDTVRETLSATGKDSVAPAAGCQSSIGGSTVTVLAFACSVVVFVRKKEKN